MKKSYLYLILFEFFLFLILFLNSFISNILKDYYLIIFILFLIIIFKYLFGIEKDHHRYTKDIILEIFITVLISFLIYYLFGLIIGFLRTENYYSLYGIKNFILPIILTIILKEYLRYIILTKSSESILLVFLETILFIFLDITNIIPYTNFNSKYNIFIFISLTLLPSITRNITNTYISLKVGYKPVIILSLILNLYRYLLPIVPNTGDYIFGVIELIFPLIILYKVSNFFNKIKDYEIERNYHHNRKFSLIIPTILIIFLVYITSGEFHYYALAIASGSMTPNIRKGDIVIIEKINNNYDNLSIGTVIAYKYNDIVIVHRLVNIIKDKEEYYFYTKGDANKDIDNYPITKDMILGIVNIKIPFLGYPTVWLNEL